MSNTKKSMPILTKYELAAILSARAFEIANGEPITIQNPRSTNPIDIAYQEFEAKRSPKKVIRNWPDGTIEIWNLSELKVL
jgi:DNA-directed RNA polymerase subunit K/omega